MAERAAAPILAALLAHGEQASAAGAPELIGISAGMADVRLAIERAAREPFPVLVEGESGSGKELAARALHRRGTRRDNPYCTPTGPAVPTDLGEAERSRHS